MFKKSKFSSGFATFKHGKKNKLSEIFSARFWDSHFYVLKRKILYEFLPKCFKTTERLSLAVCGSLCWEKQFLLIFIPFYLLDQKKLFKKIQIFFQDLPLSKYGKEKKISEYFSAPFWDSHFFWLKEKFSMNFPKNASKQQKGIV